MNNTDSSEDIRTSINEFSSDPIFLKIREKFNTPSFFEMIDKTRSETAHSAFIKWLLMGEGVSGNSPVTPIILFLKLLAKRALQQSTPDNLLMPNEISDAISSGKIRVEILEKESKTEKLISELAEDALEDYVDEQDKYDVLKGIIQFVTDRIDIFIKCDLGKCEKYKQLEILLENKVDSKEGKDKDDVSARNRSKSKIPQEYSENWQTKRYYYASARKREDICQLYVFLTPKLGNEDLKKLSETRNSDTKLEFSKDEHYININYQDILDDIIDKILILTDSSVNSRTKLFCNEYKNEITFPHLEDDITHDSIANPKISGIEDFWDNYRGLICKLVCAYSAKNFCLVNKEDEYYSFPIKKNGIKLNGKIKEIQHVGLTVSQIPSKLGKYSYEYIIVNIDSLRDNGVLNLLSSYCEENLDILTAIIGIIKNGDSKYKEEASTLYDTLSKNGRDNTRYYVFYKDECQNDKPASKGETAYLIFKTWAEKVKSKNVELEEIRSTFPRSISSYYASGRYFKSLFYEWNVNAEYSYDPENKYKDKIDARIKEKGEEEVKADILQWDFFPSGHSIEIKDGKKITCLKKWGKDDSNKLHDKIKKLNCGISIKKYEQVVDDEGNESNEKIEAK